LPAHKAKVHLPTNWLGTLRIYFAVIALGNLAWEALQLPLYTLWTTGTVYERVFAVVHCTAGDILIAFVSTTVAVLLARAQRLRHVAALAIVFGGAYTAFSEWFNVYVRRSWAYSDWMPVLTVYGKAIGISPLLQWVIVPAVAFWLSTRSENRPTGKARKLQGLER
jgi:hypothetical protein